MDGSNTPTGGPDFDTDILFCRWRNGYIRMRDGLNGVDQEKKVAAVHQERAFTGSTGFKK